MEPDERLFRRDAGPMVAALTRIFGTHNLALAEDVVQDAFCRALEVWKIRGVPDNPSAWLMRTAKNKAIDVLRRERVARTFAPELGRVLESEWTLVPTVEELFRPSAIKDDQLRMMFSCCHPALPEQAQVALVLHLLCGFTMKEIAGAFLIGEEAAQKRIQRGKKVLSASRDLFNLADRDCPDRLSAVQRALYLLFNEGYHGASAIGSVRAELCRGAMRLASLLLENRISAAPSSYALCALMYLDAARLPGRTDAAGNLRSLFEQDRTSWDSQLTRKGQQLLDLSASGSEVTEYHIEAAIAALHAGAKSVAETDWARIVSLYDELLRIRPSPVIELNRAIAIGQLHGAERGLQAIYAIKDGERLAEYPFYEAALGEFQLRCHRPDLALKHFQAARKIARNAMEHQFLDHRMHACEESSLQRA